MALGFMMIPAPTGLSRGARSRTVAVSPRKLSSRASERPPMPPPTIDIGMRIREILFENHGILRTREPHLAGVAGPRAPLGLRRSGAVRAGVGADLRPGVARARAREPGETPRRLLHHAHGPRAGDRRAAGQIDRRACQPLRASRNDGLRRGPRQRRALRLPLPRLE